MADIEILPTPTLPEVIQISPPLNTDQIMADVKGGQKETHAGKAKGRPKGAAKPKKIAPKAPAAGGPIKLKDKHAATHPPWADMMVNAVKNLNEKSGSSIPAIKKYITASYKIDAEKITPLLRRGVKAALTSNKLKQIKGKGLSGSFKLAKPKSGKENPKRRPKTNKPKKAKEGIKKVKKTKPRTKKAAGTPKKAKVSIKPKVSKKAIKKLEGQAATPLAPTSGEQLPLAPALIKATAKPKKAKIPRKPKTEAAKKAKSAGAKAAMKAKSAKSLKARKAPKPKSTKKASPPKIAITGAAIAAN